MKATMVVFLSEIHVAVFEPKELKPTIIDSNGLSYERLLNVTKKAINKAGASIIDEYTENNEFGDPITCYFIES